MPTAFGKQRQKTQQAVKEVVLEKKLEEKYGGKALKMLEKMSGYKLGQGVGKFNQGILNPIEQVAVVDKGGLGYSKPEKPSILKKKKDDIDMDINNQEDAQKQEEEVKQKKAKLDSEERAFIDLLNERRRQSGHLKSKRDYKASYTEMQQQMSLPDNTIQAGKLNIIDMTQPDARQQQAPEKRA